MNEFLMLILCGIAGSLLGVLFFGGLWWTIRKGIASRHAAAWFIGSLLLRTGLALTGIYFIGASSWQRLAACLTGFVIARLLVSALTRQNIACAVSEVRHAS